MRHFLFCLLLWSITLTVHAQAGRYDSLITVAAERHDTAAMIDYFIEKTDRYGVDTSGFGKMNTNNFIYDNIFSHSTDRRQLKKAAGYMQQILRTELDGELGKSIYAAWMDTYANLLYKLGQRKKALTYQEEVVRRAPTGTGHAKHLEQMKAGEPTWK